MSVPVVERKECHVAVSVVGWAAKRAISSKVPSCQQTEAWFELESMTGPELNNLTESI